MNIEFGGIEIEALQEFTGESLNNCKKAFTKAEGNIHLAFGYLRAQGCLVYTETPDLWEYNYARAMGNEVKFIDNKLQWIR